MIALWLAAGLLASTPAPSPSAAGGMTFEQASRIHAARHSRPPFDIADALEPEPKAKNKRPKTVPVSAVATIAAPIPTSLSLPQAVPFDLLTADDQQLQDAQRLAILIEMSPAPAGEVEVDTEDYAAIAVLMMLLEAN